MVGDGVIDHVLKPLVISLCRKGPARQSVPGAADAPLVCDDRRSRPGDGHPRFQGKGRHGRGEPQQALRHPGIGSMGRPTGVAVPAERKAGLRNGKGLVGRMVQGQPQTGVQPDRGGQGPACLSIDGSFVKGNHLRSSQNISRVPDNHSPGGFPDVRLFSAPMDPVQDIAPAEAETPGRPVRTQGKVLQGRLGTECGRRRSVLIPEVHAGLVLRPGQRRFAGRAASGFMQPGQGGKRISPAESHVMDRPGARFRRL